MASSDLFKKLDESVCTTLQLACSSERRQRYGSDRGPGTAWLVILTAAKDHAHTINIHTVSDYMVAIALVLVLVRVLKVTTTTAYCTSTLCAYPAVCWLQNY